MMNDEKLICIKAGSESMLKLPHVEASGSATSG